ncbi:MAG TPA: hypothetical protein DCL61_28695 [Cyanobacteria bacterium UBA12227]|nr:hypothetical protein [Cyanobacteria bacterium UBA12227]HAX89028.1 hypothetical protein [Cyanobacteria bacterium UBA11370]HBY77627.1 hypothetical protein [Cyanobacteria bacterium UBA11148]
MTSDNTDSNQRSLIKVIYRFLGGAVLGILVLLIPVTYGASNNFGLVQVGVAFVFIISCGLLSIVWGGKFIDTVTRMLNSTGL